MFGRVYVEPRIQHGGFTFVFQRAPDCAARVRRFPNEAVGLVIVVDGDVAGVQARSAGVDRALREAGREPLQADERIAVCVPTRNVETWQLWLLGRRDVDELTDYKSAFQAIVRSNPMARRHAVDAWCTPMSQQLEETERARLPSMAKGRAELARLRDLSRK